MEENNQILRTCKKCGETKPIEEFMKYKSRQGCLSYRFRCRKCYRSGSLPDKFPSAKPGMKFCTGCGVEKDLGMFSYSNGKHHSRCKRCACDWARDHYNKEDRKEYREKNKERLKQKGVEYRASGRARINWNRYKEKHPERIKEKKKDYYNKNKEKINAKRGTYPSQNKKHQTEYRHNNKIRINLIKARYTDRQVKDLGDSYVVANIKRVTGLSTKLIRQHAELIENNKMQIKVKRLIKSLKDENSKAS